MGLTYLGGGSRAAAGEGPLARSWEVRPGGVWRTVPVPARDPGEFCGDWQHDWPQTEFWDSASPGSRSPGEGANFSPLPLPLPAGPSPPPRAQLEQPRQGRRVRIRMTREAGFLAQWPPSASVAPVQRCGVGQGGAVSRQTLRAVPGDPGLFLPGATKVGGRERRRPPSATGKASEGCEWLLKLAEIPPQLAAAGGSARGFLGLGLLRVSFRQRLLLGL